MVALCVSYGSRPHRLLHLRHWDTDRDVICVIRFQEMETQWHWQGEMSSSPGLSTMCHPHYYFISRTIVSPSSPFGKRDLWPLERIITSHYPPERRIANDPIPQQNPNIGQFIIVWKISHFWRNAITVGWHHLSEWIQYASLLMETVF